MTTKQLAAHITALLDNFHPQSMLSDELDEWRAEYAALRNQNPRTFRAVWNRTVKAYMAEKELYPRPALQAIVKQSEALYQEQKTDMAPPEEPEPEPEAEEDDLLLPPEPEEAEEDDLEAEEEEAEEDAPTAIDAAPPLRTRPTAKKSTRKLMSTLQAEQDAQIEALYQLQTSVMATIKKAHKHARNELNQFS